MFENIEDSEMLLIIRIKEKLEKIEKEDTNIIIFSNEERAFLQKIVKNIILKIGKYVFNGENNVEECVKKIYTYIIEKNFKLNSLMSE